MICKNLFLLVVVTALFSPPAASEDRPDMGDYVASTGAIVTPLRHMAYEDTLQLQFRFGMPAILVDAVPEAELAQVCPPEAGTVCRWELQLQALTQSLRAAVTDPSDSNPALPLTTTQASLTVQNWWPRRPLQAPAHRVKRGFWSLAAGMVPLVAEYFPKLVALFKTTPPPTEQNSIVRVDAVVPSTRSIQSLPDQLKSLANQFKTIKAAWSEKAESVGVIATRRIEALELALQAVFDINAVDQAVSVCEENLLPGRLVRMPALKAALAQATAYLTTYDAQLVVPTTNVSLYYRVKSATCSFSGDKFLINFRLPVKRMGAQLNLFHLHPAAFKVRDVTCHFLLKPLTLALVNQRAIFLPEDYCPPNEFFCSLPRDSNPTDATDCLQQFFSFKTMDPTPCEPTCVRSKQPVVTQITTNTFWIVTDDAFPLTVDCGSGTPNILPEIMTGAYLVNLPCQCSVQYGGSILVSAHLLCDQHSPSETKIQKIIPIQWTTRVLPPFLDMVRRPTVIAQREVAPMTENSVDVTDEAEPLPPWVEELLIGLGCTALVPLVSVLFRCLRRCRRRRARTDSLPLHEIQPPPLPSRSTSMTSLMTTQRPRLTLNPPQLPPRRNGHSEI